MPKKEATEDEDKKVEFSFAHVRSDSLMTDTHLEAMISDREREIEMLRQQLTRVEEIRVLQEE